MRRSRLPAFLAAAAVCLPLASCGDDDVGDPIPPERARELNSQLDAVQSNVRQGLCDEATTAVAQARVTVDKLDDDGVGADVQDALGDGVDNLDDLVRQDCQGEEETTTPETTPMETETTPTETTPTETTPTETTPTETEPTPTEPLPLPDDEEPDEGDGGEQFDPNVPPGQAKKGEFEG